MRRNTSPAGQLPVHHPYPTSNEAQLANAVATVVNLDVSDERQSLRDWLADKTITEWRGVFAASTTEIAD